MSITSKINPSKQLSTFIVTGKISSNEIIEAIELFYKKQPSGKVLWDFRYADLEALIFSNELESIASSFFKSKCNFQKIFKTAIVASPDLWFSVARMYAKFVEIQPMTIGANTKIPKLDEICDGDIVLIRFIRSDRQLDIFGENFTVSKDLVYSYVKAIIVTQIHQLQLYLGDDFVQIFDYKLPVYD